MGKSTLDRDQERRSLVFWEAIIVACLLLVWAKP